MGFSKRKATTKSSISQYDFDQVHGVFLSDVKSMDLNGRYTIILDYQLGPNGNSLCSSFPMDNGSKGARRVEIGVDLAINVR